MFGRVIESEPDTTESESDCDNDDEDAKRLRVHFKDGVKSNP